MSNFIIVDTTPADIRARTLIEALIDEYSTRYAPYRIDSRGEAEHGLARYPDELFSPPDGAFILVIRDGKTVGGGAFRRYDAQTVELKRVWTHPSGADKGWRARSSQRLSSGPRSKGIVARI